MRWALSPLIVSQRWAKGPKPNNPSVPGGGAHHTGQSAFDNMLWQPHAHPHHYLAPKVNMNLKRYAVILAITASIVASLVLVHGHHIESVPKLPLMIRDSVKRVEKTYVALKVLKQISTYLDIEKAKDRHAIHPSTDNECNRHHINWKGPLIVYRTMDAKLVEAFRNIPRVDIMNIERLNLLKLAPGGHLVWFVIWTKLAFKKLDSIYGSFKKPLEKENYIYVSYKLSAPGTPAAKGVIDLPYGWKMRR
jgi:large subunit ribosomal protein L4e